MPLLKYHLSTIAKKVPSAVSYLELVNTTSSEITIEWEHSTSGIQPDSYVIMVNDNEHDDIPVITLIYDRIGFIPSTNQEITSVSMNFIEGESIDPFMYQYTITGLSSATQYTIEVLARNQSGDSNPSNTLNITTL